MKKEDLKDLDVVTLRNGDKLAFTDESILMDLSHNNRNGLYYLKEINDNLRYEDNDNYDIVKVERPIYETIYTTEDRKEYTIKELEELTGIKDLKIVKESK